MRRTLFALVACCSAFFAFDSLAVAQEKPLRKANPMGSYLRLVRDGSSQGVLKSLDTSVRTFRSKDSAGVTVDLIGAVHIGEGAYYEQLNKQFDQYEVLLYELVAAEGTVVPKGGKREGTNPISFLQDSAKSFLALESQLEKIDYTKKHFVRADMTPEQIGAKMKERGDTPFTVALSAFADVLRQQNLKGERDGIEQGEVNDSHGGPQEEFSFLDMLDNPLQVKRMMAMEFATSGNLDQSLGQTLNQMLIIDRNAEALRYLQKEIASGKKKIGIFYGAAHLPDFEEHLVRDFGLIAEEPVWVTAWDLSRSNQKVKPNPLSKLRDIMSLFE